MNSFSGGGVFEEHGRSFLTGEQENLPYISLLSYFKITYKIA